MEEETYTVPEAAKVLGVSPRRVHQMCYEQKLSFEYEEDSNRLRIPQREVHQQLEQKNAKRRHASQQAAASSKRERELLEELREMGHRIGHLEGRLELTEVTESTLRESLQRERERADRLEVELAEAQKSWLQRLLGR